MENSFVGVVRRGRADGYDTTKRQPTGNQSAIGTFRGSTAAADRDPVPLTRRDHPGLLSVICARITARAALPIAVGAHGPGR